VRSLLHIVYYTNIGSRRCPIKVVGRNKTERVRALLCLLYFFPTKKVLGLKGGQLINDYRGLRVRWSKRKLFWLPIEVLPLVECLFKFRPGQLFFKDFDKDSVRYLSKKWLGVNPKELRKRV